ncbi:unnamed protein product [Calypogeia fissa]
MAAVAHLSTAATAIQCSTSSCATELKGCYSRRIATLLPSPSSSLPLLQHHYCFSPRSSLSSNGGASGRSASSSSAGGICVPVAATRGFGRKRMEVARRAKFQQFTPSDDPSGALEDLPDLEESEDVGVTEGNVPDDERDDRVLPESLEGAILQSSESAALFVQSGGTRAIVELLLPQMTNAGLEGDQLKLWNMSRLFLEDLQSRLGTQQLKAIFPDAGVAAMLKFQWKDAAFTFASLSDRKPVSIDDEVVVLVQPDFQMLSSVEKIASAVLGEVDGPPRPLIMFNPALQSGEVGIGLNVRRMREFFLSTFNPVYSMRTLSFGAIFRRYPGPWQVFFDDENVPGRFVLASEEPSRPVLEDVEMLFLRKGQKDEDGADKEPGPLQNLAGMLSSMSRFMQSLSR